MVFSVYSYLGATLSLYINGGGETNEKVAEEEARPSVRLGSRCPRRELAPPPISDSAIT